MSQMLATESVEFASDEETTPRVETDSLLLRRFLADRDSEAFEALVLRHGPKVLRVCRRWLGDSQDAEDAFQATFVVLVNRAGAIRRSESLEAWLCGVARRVAGRAKMRADRRRRREGAEVDVREVPASGTEPVVLDLSPVLRAEVDRLPEKYRRPLELCYWQGLSNEEAADRLQCPTGTLKWRLSRGREILRDRLVRLGMAIAALLMWRRPAEASEGWKPVDPPAPRLPQPGRGRPGEGFVTADLVRRTIDLAAVVRDLSLPAAKSAAPAQMTRGRAPRRRGLFRVALPFAIVGLLVASAMAVPAFRPILMSPFSSNLGFPPGRGSVGASPSDSGPDEAPVHCLPRADRAD